VSPGCQLQIAEDPSGVEIRIKQRGERRLLLEIHLDGLSKPPGELPDRKRLAHLSSTAHEEGLASRLGLPGFQGVLNQAFHAVDPIDVVVSMGTLSLFLAIYQGCFSVSWS
jgi:hypothetical protein